MNKQTDKLKPKKECHFYPVSLRDYFAGLAMQGMMQGVNNPDGEWISTHAYEVADAMLLRRKNPKHY